MRTVVAGFVVLAILSAGCGRSDFSESVKETTQGSQIATPASLNKATPKAPSFQDQRSVVRNASLALRVESVEKAEKSVTEATLALGGYVESSQSTDLDTAKPIIVMALRVPVQTFDQAVAAYERLGIRLSKSISSSDVSTQIVDMDARLQTMQAEEASLRRMLARSGSLGQTMEIQRKITEVRSTIESAAAQSKKLKQLSALSSIELRLQQTAQGAMAGHDPNWATEALAQAGASATTLYRGAFIGLLWVLVYSPIWIVVGFVARKFIRRRADVT